MKPRLKVYFIIPTLTAGGAERIMSFLADNLDPKIFDTKLIVIGTHKNTAYSIDGSKVLYLNKSRVLAGIPNLFSILKVEKPNIVISSIVHLNATMGFISIFFPKITFIGRQSSISKVDAKYNPRRKESFAARIVSSGTGLLIKLALQQLDYIICQSADMKADCITMYGIETRKLHVLHNPITRTQKPDLTNTKDNNGILKLITVGRLVKIKGHKRILDVLSRLKTPFKLTIIGTGPEYKNIFSQIEKLGLKQDVRYIEFTNNVEKYLAESDFYLQGSYAEGFPNALLESCSVGTPVIAFDAPGGTREIVENNKNGFIAKNEDDFLKYLNQSTKIDPKLVIESVMNKFRKDIILDKYARFLIKSNKTI